MSHDDFETEPVHGLPEEPPRGEDILWQGAPSTWAMANRVFGLPLVVGYFALLALWRMVDLLDRGEGLLVALTSASWFVALGLVTAGIILLMARMVTKATVYTVTSARVAMRIGVAVTLTLNLPYRWIESADVRRRRDGSGDIALTMKGDTRISYLVLWPHARPWRLNPAVPMLRCLPEVDTVARLIGEAGRARLTEAEADPVREPAIVAAE